jgi:predicted RNA-binding protein YlqC (UPF0109 family)
MESSICPFCKQPYEVHYFPNNCPPYEASNPATPMPSMGNVREWLLMTIRLIVDHPDEVTIFSSTSTATPVLQIRVHPRDRSQLIGRPANCVVALAGAVAKRLGVAFEIDIQEN